MTERATLGTILSGAGHLGLIGWALFGGVFNTPPDEPLDVTEVTMISGAEFAALTDTPVETPPVIEAPEPVAPEVPEPDFAPPVPAPEPEVTEAPEPEPVAPEPQSDPEPVPPEALPQAEVTEEAPTVPDAPEVPDSPPGAALVLENSDRPKPRPVPRVAPLPVPDSPPEVETSDTAQPAVTPDASEVAAETGEPQPETAPEAAATEIVTEAETESGGEVVSALAPTGSPRPPKRPKRAAVTPAAVETEDPAPAPATDPAPEPARDPAPVPQGPPMTAGEKDKLVVGVSECWNVGALSTEALNVTVTVFVAMNRNGTPDISSIRRLNATGGSEGAARQAYEAARRAIILCGSDGFDLPDEKYGQWQEIEMVFNPEKMQIK